MREVAPNGAGDGWKITVRAVGTGETGRDYKEKGRFGEGMSINLHPRAPQPCHRPSFVATVVPPSFTVLIAHRPIPAVRASRRAVLFH